MMVWGRGFCEWHICARCLFVLTLMARYIHVYHGRYTFTVCHIRCVVLIYF